MNQTVKETSNGEVNVKHWFDKIESIKGTMSMANGDRPELWIQRQNLQDLYRQIILNDIDFTIDKKLEQDLWNYVFKLQINYFQSQIKKESSRSSGESTSSSAQSQSSSSVSIKKLETQANYSFFLEAARGFYTKLLEDIIFKYNLNETRNHNIPFCQSFPSLFDKIKSFGSPDVRVISKEKQIFYICQHILTHLGDIARYANQFQQAKNYYYHAIKIVPYLGHPYNQLGILFETSRTNQLATVFYYIRSIAVRYTFPLAANNLDNFFYKLIEIPINRYNPSQVPNNLVKLSHKDLLTLYLQINGVIYFSKLNKHQRLVNNFKLNSYIDLFKPAFELFMNTSIQRDKLDSIQLCQVIVIMIYILSVKSSNSLLNQTAIDLFSFMVEQFIHLYNESSDLILSSLYIAFNFIEHFDPDLIKTNKLWSTNKSCHLTVQMLNDLVVNDDKFESYDDYPLNEDRMLDSFQPLEKSNSKLSTKKYFKYLNSLNESDESSLRKNRIFSCVKRILSSENNEGCFIQLNDNKFIAKCPLEEELVSSPINNQDTSPSQQIRKKRQNVAISSITKNNNQSETSPNKSNKTIPLIKNPSTSSSSSPSPLTISSSSTLSNSNDRINKTVSFQVHNVSSQPAQNIRQPSNLGNQSFFPSASTSFRQFTNQNNDISSLNTRPSIDNKNVFPSFLPSIDPITMNNQNLYNQKNYQQRNVNQPTLFNNNDSSATNFHNNNNSSSMWPSFNENNLANITSNLNNLNAFNNQSLWSPFQQQADISNSSDSLLLNENLNINELLIQQLLLNTNNNNTSSNNNNNTQQSNPSNINSNNLWPYSFQQEQNFKK